MCAAALCSLPQPVALKRKVHAAYMVITSCSAVPAHCTAVYSEDEGEDSEDEEADRNLPLLSQYVQSGGGRSPARRQQEERRQGVGRSPLGLDGQGEAAGETPGHDARSPLGGQPLASGPDGSPMLSADPAMIGEGQWIYCACVLHAKYSSQHRASNLPAHVCVFIAAVLSGIPHLRMCVLPPHLQSPTCLLTWQLPSVRPPVSRGGSTTGRQSA